MGGSLGLRAGILLACEVYCVLYVFTWWEGYLVYGCVGLGRVRVSGCGIFESFSVSFYLKSGPRGLVMVAKGGKGKGAALLQSVVFNATTAIGPCDVVAIRGRSNVIAFALPAAYRSRDCAGSFSGIGFCPAGASVSVRRLRGRVLGCISGSVGRGKGADFNTCAGVRSLVGSVFGRVGLRVYFGNIDRSGGLVFIGATRRRFNVRNLSTKRRRVLSGVFVLFARSVGGRVVLVSRLRASLRPTYRARVLSILHHYSRTGSYRVVIAARSPLMVTSTCGRRVHLLMHSSDKCIGIGPYSGDPCK